MPQMSLKDHGHTPYPVMLFAAMQNWRDEHGGALPGNYREKKALKEILGKLNVEENQLRVQIYNGNYIYKDIAQTGNKPAQHSH